MELAPGNAETRGTSSGPDEERPSEEKQGGLGPNHLAEKESTPGILGLTASQAMSEIAKRKSSLSSAFIPGGSDVEETNASVPRRSRARMLLESAACEAFLTMITLVNFAVVILDVDAQASNKEPGLWVDILRATTFVCIVLEFGLRSYVERSSMAYSGWAWLNFVIIVTGLVEYVVPAGTWEGFRVIRVLRALRLCRPSRIMMRFKFFAELVKLLQMMGSCFRALAWSAVLLCVALSVWGAVAVTVIQPYVRELAEEDGQWADCERCKRSFSSVWDANITLFQTVVAGDSWGLVAIPIIERNPWAAVVFMGSLLTIVFGVLNLGVAVVVDTAAERRAKDINGRGAQMEYEEIKEKGDLKKLFKKIDNDGSGQVSFDELTDGVRRIPELRHLLRVMDIDSEDLLQLFQLVDTDGSGEIDPDEFTEAIYRFQHTESKTALRFVKHLLAKLMEHQVDFVDRVGDAFSEVEHRVSGYKSDLQADLSTVRDGLVEKVVVAEQTYNKAGEALQLKLEEQMLKVQEQIRSIETSFHEALETTLSSAMEKTKHLAQTVEAANGPGPLFSGEALVAQPAPVKPAPAMLERQMSWAEMSIDRGSPCSRSPRRPALEPKDVGAAEPKTRSDGPLAPKDVGAAEPKTRSDGPDASPREPASRRTGRTERRRTGRTERRRSP